MYRRLLRLCAPAMDREYGAAMEEMLAARLAIADGRWSRGRVWGREVLSLAVLAWTEHRRRRAAFLHKAGPMSFFAQELQYAGRRLWRSPGFSAVTALTLALAIGANAAIFAVVERVVISPLPYPASDRLVDIDHGAVALKVPNFMGSTPGLYFLYRDRARTLSAVAVYATSSRTLTGAGIAERLSVTRATPSLGTVLQVPPAYGRWFSADDGRHGAPAVAVLSHRLWTHRFNANPASVGNIITLDGQATTVIGVMPPGFAFPSPAVDLWIAEQVNEAAGFGFFGYQGVARLADGATPDSARRELQGLLADLRTTFPDDSVAAGNSEIGLTFTGLALKDTMLGDLARPLWMLLASVGLLLLIAGANVANLVLVRSEARQREVAVRRALGASVGGLVRHFFAESLLLAGVGGAAGLSLAYVALRLLVLNGPATLPRLHEVALSPWAIAYAAALTLISAAIFGLLPLLRSGRGGLREGARGASASRQRHRTRHMLLGAQMAMALVLLVASGLIVRSLQNLRTIDPGFNPDSTLAFTVGLPPWKYTGAEATLAAHQAILQRLQSMPGVIAASATTCLPLSFGCNGNTLLVEGTAYPPGVLPPLSLFRAVASGYLETMGMRILRGRSIEPGDVDRREPVVVVSESLARAAFGDGDPIGRRVASNQPPPRPGAPPVLEWLTVVGVVGDTPMRALNEPPMPSLFMPLSRGRTAADAARLVPGMGTVSFVARTTTPPLALVPAIRQAVTAIDADVALAQVTTLQAMVDRASAQMAFTMVLLTMAAAMSLVLGLIGIYGVTAFIVSQRTGEIGVRLALGAEPAGITRQIVMQGGVVSLAGIAIGLIAALGGSRWIASVLYGVSPRDPIVLLGMATLLLVMALIACWLPARRAAALSPTTALRAD